MKVFSADRVLIVTLLVAAITPVISVAPAHAAGEPSVTHLGVSKWTPTSSNPDFYSTSNNHVLETDLRWDSDFRKSAFYDIEFHESHVDRTVFEFEFWLRNNDLASSRQTELLICDLPGCISDSPIGDTGPFVFTAMTDQAQNINPGVWYNIEIYIGKGTASSSGIQLNSVTGAYHDNCNIGLMFCSFENYSHRYNKGHFNEPYASQHYFPGTYGNHNGGSFILWDEDTFGGCPGAWGFNHLIRWCSSYTNGPESPGRVTIKPVVGAPGWGGNAYQTVGVNNVPGDHFSVEYVVQCLTGPCLTKHGYNVMQSGVLVEQHASPLYSIPVDNKYYLCRYDSKHSAGLSVTSGGSQLQVFLGNKTQGTQLRIDSMALYGYVSYAAFMTSTEDNNACNELP
jgi:hypothetical protein